MKRARRGGRGGGVGKERQDQGMSHRRYVTS
jgi:hypothetical protein